MKVIKVEPLVREVLERNKICRENDHMLYVEVIYKIKPELVNGNFRHVFENHKFYGLPSFESVSRCRRKLQEKYENLRASDDVQIARAEKEIEMYEYALK